jgi:flagellar basal-body rod protein FlgB
MKVDFFHDQTLDAVEAYMSRLTQRQQVVFSNLINAETPGYKTKDISFHATIQELLSDNSVALKTSSPEHSGEWTSLTPQAQVFEVEGLPSGKDLNNVALDQEMMKMSETAFGYSLMTQIVRGKLRTIASSINEGRAS